MRKKEQDNFIGYVMRVDNKFGLWKYIFDNDKIEKGKGH
jgi:hypothetical protein